MASGISSLQPAACNLQPATCNLQPATSQPTKLLITGAHHTLVSAVMTPAPSQADEAVRRAAAGDADAFETVYRAHAGRVHALCLRMTGDETAAKTLTQDVFVRAWEKLATFRGDSAFSTWLHRLAVNVVLGEHRTATRRAEDDLGDDEGPAPPAAARADDPALRMDLEQAIRALPPMARQVLVLVDIEGYRHAEVGAMLGIAEGTSKAHLFRARRLVREALER
jgi:RNA polymerase sigma-70 factor (ECF subfamily)